MNNEPVAWMHQNPDYAISKHQSLEYNIPLYTHPMRELSDEEIWKLWQTHLNDEITVFARELLKKAKEK